MRIIGFSIFIIFLTLAGCKRSEPNGNFRLIFQNETSASIRVVQYKSLVDVEIFLFELEPQASEIEDIQTYGGVPEYQHEITSYFASDSIVVFYNDTLRVVHLIKDSSKYPDANEMYIGFEEAGNISNVEYYNLQRDSEDAYRGTYTFTQEDLDYAIAINE